MNLFNNCNIIRTIANHAKLDQSLSIQINDLLVKSYLYLLRADEMDGRWHLASTLAAVLLLRGGVWESPTASITAVRPFSSVSCHVTLELVHVSEGLGADVADVRPLVDAAVFLQRRQTGKRFHAGRTFVCHFTRVFYSNPCCNKSTRNDCMIERM